ncbi:unnamed protein product [Clonostachys rosea f. rosea IK726]|uniref:Uncharacterized protein n=1 Tax=Clonostachys rosea f. rosea IK726 TaxID=1349383 RepID=A0ACA9TXP9_BIOOC|nr:unnamed protein product [Clonostachys rosea f. rosea IK726]
MNPNHIEDRKLMNVFDCEDLEPILAQKVVKTYVEFTPGEGSRPHTELRLVLENAVLLEDSGKSKTILSCSIGANPSRSDNKETSVTFRPLTFSDHHRRCFASFQFDVSKRNAAVRDFIKALRGNIREADLSVFVSCKFGKPPITEGCRDIVTQWVIRLNEHQLMGWDASEVKSAYTLRRDNLPLQFHGFIAKGYTHSLTEGSTLKMTIDIPMVPGFLVDDAARVKEYGGIRLPYA